MEAEVGLAHIAALGHYELFIELSGCGCCGGGVGALAKVTGCLVSSLPGYRSQSQHALATW